MVSVRTKRDSLWTSPLYTFSFLSGNQSFKSVVDGWYSTLYGIKFLHLHALKKSLIIAKEIYQ